MEPFHQYIDEYRRQMQVGAVPKAYKGLLEYMLALKAQLMKSHPDYSASGSLYTGYMDMSYFAFTPPALAQRKLKVAIVLLHADLRIEAWLAGANKQVQQEYWQLIMDSGWRQYRLVPSIQGADAIIEHVLAPSPDFRDLDGLTDANRKRNAKIRRRRRAVFGGKADAGTHFGEIENYLYLLRLVRN